MKWEILQKKEGMSNWAFEREVTCDGSGRQRLTILNGTLNGWTGVSKLIVRKVEEGYPFSEERDMEDETTIV
jgi:hypothetical protein